MKNLNINMEMDLNRNHSSIESVVEYLNELGLDNIQGMDDVNGVSVALSYANQSCEAKQDEEMWADEMNAHLDYLAENGADDDVLDIARDYIENI